MPSNGRFSVWFNFSYLGIIQVSNFLLSLLVIPYVISVVGPEGFGVIAVAQVIIFYLSVTTDYGFNRTATKEIALYKEDTRKISSVFSTVIISKALLCLASFIILIVLVLTVPIFRDHYRLYLLAFSFVIGQAILVNWFYQGMEKMKYTAITSLFSRLIFVGLVFLFIKNKGDEEYYIFFMGLGNIIAGLVSFFAAWKMYKISFRWPSAKAIKNELKEGWHITASNLSMTTIQYFPLFILRLFTNDLIVGFYSIAERIYFAMKLMLDVFSQAAYPRVCRLLQEGTRPTMDFFRKTYSAFLCMVLAGCAGIFIFSPEIIRFFAGDHHEYTAFLLRMLSVAALFVCLNIPASLVLLAGDHKRNYLRIFTTGTFICLLANFGLAPIWDAKGTVYAILITEIFITFGLYYELYRVYKPGMIADYEN